MALALLCITTLAAWAYDFEVNGIYYLKNGSNAIVTMSNGDTQYSGVVIIPETVTHNGKTYKVTAIGGYAFYGNDELRNVIIPNSVMTIGTGAFMDCTGLTNIVIPNSVTSIGEEAFEGCSKLTDIVIPNSVISIGPWAFIDTPWFENQPDGMVYAGNVAYEYKGEIPEGTSLTLRADTKGIADEAFCVPGHEGLTSIDMPNSLINIGAGAFRSCRGLTSIVIPNSVTTIGREAFYQCSGLTDIVITI